MQISTRGTKRQGRISDAQLAAWKAFLRAHTVVTRALERELLAAHQLPLAEYDVLVQLQGADKGALRMAQLADQVLLSRSGLTRLVERLEVAGLVRREACPSDARGSFAVITDQGRRRLREAAPSHLSSVYSHFAKVLSAEQVESLRVALEQVVSAVPPGCGSALPESALEARADDRGECAS